MSHSYGTLSYGMSLISLGRLTYSICNCVSLRHILRVCKCVSLLRQSRRLTHSFLPYIRPDILECPPHTHVSDDTTALTLSQTDTFFLTLRIPTSHCVVSRRCIARTLRLTHSIIYLTPLRVRAIQRLDTNSQTDTFYHLSDAFRR